MCIAISDFCYESPRFGVQKKHNSSDAQNAPGNRQKCPFKMQPSQCPCQPLRRPPSGYYSVTGRAHLAGYADCDGQKAGHRGQDKSRMSTDNVLNFTILVTWPLASSTPCGSSQQDDGGVRWCRCKQWRLVDGDSTTERP